jgi:hypothetical protein
MGIKMLLLAKLQALRPEDIYFWVEPSTPSTKSGKELKVRFLRKLFAFYFNDIILEPKGQIYEYDL